MTSPAPIRRTTPATRATTPSPTATPHITDHPAHPAHRLFALHCSECGDVIGAALPETVASAPFILCKDCTPSDEALERKLAPDAEAALRAQAASLRSSEAWQHHLAGVGARLDEMAATLDQMAVQLRGLGSHE